MSKLKSKFLIIPASFLLFLSCSNRPKEVLGMKEMTDVLVELHTLDGVLNTDGFRQLTADENNLYYEAVLEKHLINQARFDSSLVWYSRDPKKFEKIYTRVLDRLTLEETEIKEGKYHPLLPEDARVTLASINIWKDSTRFALRKDSLSRNQLAFSIADTALMTGDWYELHFRRRVEPEDSCAGQHIHFNLRYAGGRVDSIYLPSRPDGKLRRYTLRLPARAEEKIDALYGRFFAADACLHPQRAYIDSISLIRKYNADIQNELRTKTEQYESINIFRYRLFPMPGEKTDFIFRKNRLNIITE